MTETKRERRPAVKLTPQLEAKIVKTYSAGNSIVKTGELLNVPPGAVRRVLGAAAARGEVTIKTRGRYPEK